MELRPTSYLLDCQENVLALPTETLRTVAFWLEAEARDKNGIANKHPYDPSQCMRTLAYILTKKTVENELPERPTDIGVDSFPSDLVN